MLLEKTDWFKFLFPGYKYNTLINHTIIIFPEQGKE